MENIEIPDDFYIYTYNDIENVIYVLIHKSCVVTSEKFSNRKFILCTEYITNNTIDMLRHRCNVYDEIEEKTYFIDLCFKTLNIVISDYNNYVILYRNINYIQSFRSVNDLLEYLAENCPESIRNNDIKIALKY